MQPYARVAAGITPALDSIPHWRDQLTPARERYPHSMPALDRFDPIDLAQVDAVALTGRIDIKYVISLSQLPTVLAALADDYWVLQVEGVRLSRYGTLYFDSESLDLYTSHHVGRFGRYKVRSRSYLDSGLAFLEVKRKTNNGRTIKDRIRTDTLLMRLTPEANRFVDSLALFDVPTL